VESEKLNSGHETAEEFNFLNENVSQLIGALFIFSFSFTAVFLECCPFTNQSVFMEEEILLFNGIRANETKRKTATRK